MEGNLYKWEEKLTEAIIQPISLPQSFLPAPLLQNKGVQNLDNVSNGDGLIIIQWQNEL